METFTLVVWLMMGQRFEQTEITGLARAECFTRAHAIEGSRAKAFQQKEVGQIEAKAKCTAPGYKEPRWEFECAACGWDLPGRRRI